MSPVDFKKCHHLISLLIYLCQCHMCNFRNNLVACDNVLVALSHVLRHVTCRIYDMAMSPCHFEGPEP